MIRFPIILVAIQVLVHWPGPPVELTDREVSIPIEISQIRERIPALLESRNESVVVELDNVEAESEPGIVWEVYLGLPPDATPSSESPHFLGTMSLFSVGIRSHSHGQSKPAHFTFPASRALAATLNSKEEKPRLLFVPTGPLINGKPSQPKLKSPVKIGTVNIAIARSESQGEGSTPK